jgi:hypothetical protein
METIGWVVETLPLRFDPYLEILKTLEACLNCSLIFSKVYLEKTLLLAV